MPSKRSPAVHNISFCGLTGAIFVLLTAAVILYIEAFVTTSWTVKENDTSAELEGLWQTCSYVPRTEPENSWLKTSQVLISIGFFCLIASFILSTIYMTANRASKNVTITSLAFVCFVTVVFVVIGVTVYGIHARYRLSWSFGVTIASAVLTFVAGILTILQLRRSNVRIF